MQIHISEQSFRYIEVYKSQYQFEKVNSGPVSCRDCRGDIAPDLGIFRRAYRRSGYICFPCFKKDVTIINQEFDGTDRGFFIDTIGRLRSCLLSKPTLSTKEIIEAVERALLDLAYTAVDSLLGEEGAHPFAIADTAEVLIGSKSGKGG